jgi:hypothetical protein
MSDFWFGFSAGALLMGALCCIFHTWYHLTRLELVVRDAAETLK